MYCSICGRTPECGGPICAKDDGWNVDRGSLSYRWTCPDCMDGMIRMDRDDGR